ncbi:MAG: hypothetical protein M0D57_20370 [Sphingobacteriales bacterium JAD_PAG50586_3]|nr:MAG: hypothetical protein M0D57_20370 [Sphingobacteriales bacterium JAD_PAG50586_3]
MEFTREEFDIVSNSRFLLVKADVVTKVRAEFEGLQNIYGDIVNAEGIILPKTAMPKISRGENYKGLPIWF